MYSKLPSFVFGFHGCDETTKEAVLFGKQDLEPSRNDYDWLGSGIYFWEQNHERALEFAVLSKKHPGKYTNRPIKKPAVLGAVIDLGYCLNLMDAFHLHRLSLAYNLLDNAAKTLKVKLPENNGDEPDKPLRRLDRSVIEALHAFISLNTSGEVVDEKLGFEQYDTVRGLYLEGNEAYPGAHFKSQTHIQICVRNMNCIKALFDPRIKVNNPFDCLKRSLSSSIGKGRTSGNE